MIADVRPFSRPLKGKISMPGDKSISHRALIVSSISTSEVVIKNFLPAEDCLSSLRAVRALGTEVSYRDETELTIIGKGLNGLKEPGDVIDAGNSGTTLRMLSGVLAGQPFFSVLTGDESLRKRPMKRVTEPLQLMGAKMLARGDGEFPPIAIFGGDLQGINYEMTTASAQVKSCLILAGLFANGETTVVEPVPTRDHTERMLLQFGADLRIEERSITVVPGTDLLSNAIVIPGDFSSAAFFIAAALTIPDSKLIVTDVGLNRTRTGLIKILNEMGANIRIENEKFAGLEPMGDLAVTNSELSAIEVSPELVPIVIDELPILAVIATQAYGKTVVRGAEELRVKESDRIEAICTELSKMGAKIEALEDGFIVEGPTGLQGQALDSRGDHRIALSLAIAALIASSPSRIDGFECANISYPNFLDDLKSLRS